MLMKNLVLTDEVISGKVYIVEMKDGETTSFRLLSETLSHYIFSYTTDETVEVFEKAKKDVIGIFEVRECGILMAGNEPVKGLFFVFKLIGKVQQHRIRLNFKDKDGISLYN